VALSLDDCDGYRLPTDTEWEGAARCGENLRYAGSNDIDAVGWYNHNSDRTTHPVAGKDTNACGLYDMSGNVFEWTQDWHTDEYSTADGRMEPEGASEVSVRVNRGGGWNDYPGIARGAFRSQGDGPSYRYAAVGFRLTKTVP